MHGDVAFLVNSEIKLDFQGKVVFVAGGTSGINLGIAEAFARQGAKVAVLSRSQEKVDAAVKFLGVGALGFSADVRDYDAVADAVGKTREAFGLIDVVVSGAAGNFLAPAKKLSANAFKTVIDIDLLGTFNVARASWDHLRKPGAALLNITAPQAWLPTAYQIHACAAKAGVDQVTRTLAVEWGASGVRVNGLAPGPIRDTEGMRRLAPNEGVEAAVVASIPLRRYGTKTEIADAALWLCSDKARYVTGVILPVDGGWSLEGSGMMMAAVGAAAGKPASGE